MVAVKPGATVAVTGANGFVASHIVYKLLEHGFKVRAAVRDASDSTKTDHLKKMLPKDAAKDALTFFTTSLDIDGSYDACFCGADAVIHTAAVVHEVWSVALLDSHEKGTKRVLASACKSSTVCRFIQTSSIAACFDAFKLKDDPAIIFTESDWNSTMTEEQASQTGDWYGFAKQKAEKLVMAASCNGGNPNSNFDCVCLLPSMVIGEVFCKKHTKASPIMIRELLYGNSNPKSYIGFPYVDGRDVGEAHVQALLQDSAAKSPARYILTNGYTGTCFDLESKLRKLFPKYKFDAVPLHWLKMLFAPLFASSWETAMLKASLRLENSRARSDLGIGFSDMETSLTRTVESMVNNGWMKPRIKL